jgi:hypothetical protein
VSMRAVPVSTGARRRIRTFSVWIWVWGAIVLFIGALNTYADVGLGDDGLAIIGDDTNPWDVEEPPVFEPVGTTYSGDGSGVIRIPLEDHNQDAYTVTLVTGEYVDIYVTPAADLDQPANDRRYPDNIAYVYDPGDQALILPEDADLEIWVRTDAPWEFTIEPAEFTEITDGYASGKGNDYLVYRGDAVSARFMHRGDGIFFVTLQTVGGQSDRPIIESGDIDLRESWDPTSAVYISIESEEDRGAWSVDIDELAVDTPTASPTDAPADLQPYPNATDPAASGPAATIESTLR